MTTFSTSIQAAKDAINAWSGAGKICEATLVRDARGKITVYLSVQQNQNLSDAEIASLKTDLTTKLAQFFSQSIYIEEKEYWSTDLFQKLKQLRIADDLPPTGIQWYAVERGIAKKAWIQCNRTEEAAWSYEEAQSGNAPKIVSFFSYKGGMGRTTALVASALELIRRHKNVLMIDTDLEAPGLSTFFYPEDDTDSIRKGTVDYILEQSLDSSIQANMEDYIIPLTSPNYTEEGYGKLYLVCGGKLDNDYLSKLARIDSQELVDGKLKSCFVKLLKDCKSVLQTSGGIDYILIDSRAGFHDMAGVVTAQLPHGVVLFGKNSYQSWYGIQKAVSSIAASQSDPPFAIIVDSGCGSNGTVTDQEKEAFLKKSYEVFCDSYYSEDQPGLMAAGVAHSPIFVRYTPALSQDIPLYNSGKASELLPFLEDSPYTAIVDRIMNNFGDEPEGGS
ncbi:MAG: AAA family ATPase [Lachnospiraceae bacterium]|nr:AAA family ATPase [Lachnospiraceae bacterium]